MAPVPDCATAAASARRPTRSFSRPPNRETFIKALFQLADLWVDSTNEEDYVRFLQNLVITCALCPPWPPKAWRADSHIKALSPKGLLADITSLNIKKAIAVWEEKQRDLRRQRMYSRLAGTGAKPPPKKQREGVSLGTAKFSGAQQPASAVFLDTGGRDPYGTSKKEVTDGVRTPAPPGVRAPCAAPSARCPEGCRWLRMAPGTTG